MDRTYQRYIDSRKNKSSSAIGKYTQTREQNLVDNYIQQKQEIRDNHLGENSEKEMIERAASEIVKAVNKIISGQS